jgi:hypothetical protein
VPTARELLDQADALMRRNRLRRAGAGAVADDIPMLTEVFAEGDGEPDGGPHVDASSAAKVGARPQQSAPPADDRTLSAAASDVPVLTEIVEDADPISIVGEPDDAVAAAQWADFDDADVLAGDSPPPEGDAAVAAPPPEGTDAAPESTDAASEAPGGHDESPAVAGVQHAAAAVAPEAPAEVPPHAPDADAARWDALAEDVRMQVLQRIDIFTDTGLHDQLALRLQPIVDRASADLVATINQQVGQLLRSYVAEAIEREIEKWRHGGS